MTSARFQTLLTAHTHAKLSTSGHCWQDELAFLHTIGQRLLSHLHYGGAVKEVGTCVANAVCPHPWYLCGCRKKVDYEAAQIIGVSAESSGRCTLLCCATSDFPAFLRIARNHVSWTPLLTGGLMLLTQRHRKVRGGCHRAHTPAGQYHDSL